MWDQKGSGTGPKPSRPANTRNAHRGSWFQRVLIAACAAVLLCALLAPARPVAAEEPTDDSGAITTVLQAGWNMVAWLGPEAAAAELFSAIPSLQNAAVWDAAQQRYRWRSRDGAPEGGLFRIPQGAGLWLEIKGDQPFDWVRESASESVLLDLQPGENLVGWSGRDGVDIGDALSRLKPVLQNATRWNAETESFELYSPIVPDSLNTLRTLNHGDALTLELTAGARWWQSGIAPPPVVFLGELTEARQADIRGWVDGARALFAERWGVEAPFTTYVGDRDSVAPTYRRVRGHDAVPPCGNYSNSVIFLVDLCINGGAQAHEYFHALQYHLMGRPYKRVPTWMIEGSAIHAAVIYRGTQSPSQTMEEQNRQSLHRTAAALGYYDLPPLSAIEDYGAFHGQPDELGRSLGWLAVGWLEDRAGDQAFVDFFASLADAPNWQEAFGPTFGISVDDFYETFEAYRSAVAPLLPHVADDGDEPVLVLVGEMPPKTEQAVREEFSKSQSFFAESFGAGAPEYTVFAGVDEPPLAAAHRRAFGAEPRDGFCAKQSSGYVAVVDLTCRAAISYNLAGVHFQAARRRLAPRESLPAMPAGYDDRGPYWLVEPAQKYVEYAYRAAASHAAADDSRNKEISFAVRTKRPLSSMETRAGLYEEYSSATGLGFLALEWLAQRAGNPALFEYYRLLPDAASWEAAFEGAFGLTIDEFYEAFEVYRTQEAPPWPHLIDAVERPLLRFVGDVPAATQSELRDRLNDIQAFMSERFGAPVPDYTVYIATQAEPLADVFLRATGHSPRPGVCNTTYGGAVFILSLGCYATGAHGLDWSYLRGVRSHLADWGSLPPASNGLGRLGPAWLTSAIEGYLRQAYLSFAGLSDTVARRQQLIGSAARISQPLAELETSAALAEAGSDASWGLSFFAAELLTQLAGDRALLEYFRMLPDSNDWREAFETAFGIDVEQFYGEFEVYRTQEAPPWPHLTDGVEEPLLRFVGDVPAATQSELRDRLNDIQAFMSERFGAPVPDYTIYIATHAEPLANVFLRATGRSARASGCNTTLGRTVTILSLGCYSTGAHGLDWTYFANVRDRLSAGASLPPASSGVGRLGPAWLTAGIWYYVLDAYALSAGLSGAEGRRQQRITSAARVAQPLAAFEPAASFSEVASDVSAGLSFIAAEFLVQLTGEGALLDYHRQLPDSESWREAFETAFGIEVEQFYGEFKNFRAEVASGR